MRKQALRLAAFLLAAASGVWGAGQASAAPQEPLSLWYRQPAVKWTDALPVGNGRLGAMVFGGTAKERIQFNEDTLWTGEPHNYAHPGAYKYLGTLRQLLFEGKQKEAEDLAMKEFMSVPLRQKAYQDFGDLLLDFPDVDPASVTGYRRNLDLDTAIAGVEYQSKGVTYRREVFSSYPAQVIVVRLSTSPAAASSRSACVLHSAQNGAVYPAMSKRELSMQGGVQRSAIRYEARLFVQADGGNQGLDNGAISVTGADSATLILSGATNFKNFRDVSDDPVKLNNRYTTSASMKDYSSLRNAHVSDYQKLFRRVTLDLGTTAAANLPTDQRIRDFATGNDPQLVALLFQYGRYLLIASSRKGGQPANLQGIWNDSERPAVGQQVHRQHQHRDELLAGRADQSRRMHRAAVRRPRRSWPIRAPDRQGTVRRAAAGCCTTTSTSGAARRPSTPRTTASGRPAAPGWPRICGSTTCSRGDKKFLRDTGVSADEGRRAVLRRLPGAKTRSTAG